MVTIVKGAAYCAFHRCTIFDVQTSPECQDPVSCKRGTHYMNRRSGCLALLERYAVT